MRIGLDFDNTIVSYDRLFHRVAIEKSLIPAHIPLSKIAVRDYLRQQNNEDAWTEMQGYVYGNRMADAEAFPGALDFMRLAHQYNISLTIISHKTRYPFLGPQYDLHAAARAWVESVLGSGTKAIIASDQVFFELTKEDKLQRIAETRCDYFIDDLPEILLAPTFPPQTARILFDPEKNHRIEGVTATLTSWREIAKYFEELWKNHK